MTMHVAGNIILPNLSSFIITALSYFQDNKVQFVVSMCIYIKHKIAVVKQSILLLFYFFLQKYCSLANTISTYTLKLRANLSRLRQILQSVCGVLWCNSSYMLCMFVSCVFLYLSTLCRSCFCPYSHLYFVFFIWSRIVSILL